MNKNLREEAKIRKTENERILKLFLRKEQALIEN